MKTLADFKQEVLKKWYRNYNVDGHFIMTLELFDQAAELYADYKEWNAKHSNWAEGFTDGHKQGWNEALHWVCDKVEVDRNTGAIITQSILKGLKP